MFQPIQRVRPAQWITKKFYNAKLDPVSNTSTYNSILYFFGNIKSRIKAFRDVKYRKEVNGSTICRYLDINGEILIYYYSETPYGTNSSINSNRISVVIKNNVRNHKLILQSLEDALDIE